MHGYFSPHKGHAAVSYAARIGLAYGYHKPTALAAHLTDIEALRERVPLSSIRVPEGLRDWGRIGIGKARRLVGLARDFSKATGFPSFVEDRQALYKETGERLRTTIGGEDLVEWLYSFFKPPHQLTHFLVPALLNASHSYGGRVRLGEGLEFYCFLGVSNWDGSGLPVFDRGLLGTVIHEYAHSYLYPPCFPPLSKMRRAGKRLYSSRREEMRRMGYGRWDSMITESLARAVTLHYESTTGSPQNQESRPYSPSISIAFATVYLRRSAQAKSWTLRR